MKTFSFLAILCLATHVGVFGKESSVDSLLEEEPAAFVVPYGLPQMPWPADNPYSQKKAELGRLLYFDKRLSADGTISCASCHAIRRAYADENQISIGIKGRKGTRHAPTVINAGYQTFQFWDGRSRTLEEQCRGPVSNPREMSATDDVHIAHKQCQERIMKIPGYRVLFKEVFGDDSCNIENISKAIATFERTVLSGNSPYDHYLAGNKKAMTDEQIRGYAIFKKSKCVNCHTPPLFLDNKFHNIGVGMDVPNPDVGRYGITKQDKDWGAFKTPTLREVSNSYPYMHDGSEMTLEEVVDFYDKGGIANRNLDPLITPLNLSEQDKKDLVSFMKALNGDGWQHFTEPKKFPQ